MATGGIFQLITNDGRQDRMLMATSLLRQQLANIERRRAADPTISDSTPTLVDIEKTHILFTNAHFKPFAAIGYEYNKVQNQGSASLGGEVQFSIPQFGDFFHDMVLHVKLKQPTLTATATDVADQPAMRWCAFPGERLMKSTNFEVNGNPLDKYTSTVYNFYREYCVPPNKLTGWYRCMGQELPHHGFVDQPNWAGSGVTPAAGDHRFKVDVCDGNQTPSGQKAQTEAGDLELFVPLLFWFNKDPRLSVPSVAIPYGQRFINIKLASQEELVGLVPRGASTYAAPGGSLDRSTNLIRTVELYINNIFVNPEIHDIFIKRIGFTLIRVHLEQNFDSNKTSDSVHLQQMKWPVESLFVGMKMRDYNSSTAAVQSEHLDKWHTFSQVTPTGFSETGWNQYQDVTVDLTVAVTLQGEAANTTLPATLDSASVLNTRLAVGDIATITTATGTVVATVTELTALEAQLNMTEETLSALIGGDQAAVAVTALTVSRPTARSSTAAVHARTMDSMTVKAHGIPIYADFPAGFYNAYVPFHYGGSNISTPEDVGAMMITFGLYPGTYQPSGHINISRAREFYLEFTSSVVSSSVDGKLYVAASAINFLLISDGSAVLRYST